MCAVVSSNMSSSCRAYIIVRDEIIVTAPVSDNTDDPIAEDPWFKIEQRPLTTMMPNVLNPSIEIPLSWLPQLKEAIEVVQARKKVGKACKVGQYDGPVPTDLQMVYNGNGRYRLRIAHVNYYVCSDCESDMEDEGFSETFGMRYNEEEKILIGDIDMFHLIVSCLVTQFEDYCHEHY